MSHDSELLDIARGIERATVERVVTALENRWPIGEMDVPLSSHPDMLQRLRRLRGRIHGCSEHEYTQRLPNASQAEAPQESPSRMPDVQAVENERASKRRKKSPRARPAKTRNGR